jgi:hypothetical protein
MSDNSPLRSSYTYLNTLDEAGMFDAFTLTCVSVGEAISSMRPEAGNPATSNFAVGITLSTHDAEGLEYAQTLLKPVPEVSVNRGDFIKPMISSLVLERQTKIYDQIAAFQGQQEDLGASAQLLATCCIMGMRERAVGRGEESIVLVAHFSNGPTIAAMMNGQGEILETFKLAVDSEFYLSNDDRNIDVPGDLDILYTLLTSTEDEFQLLF